MAVRSNNEMDCTMSFNPEAAAFVFSAPPPQDIALAPYTSPTLPQDADFPFAMALMFNCGYCVSSLVCSYLISHNRLAIPRLRERSFNLS